jgi:hypothetical protein
MNIFIFGNGNISFPDFIQYYEKPLGQWISQESTEFTVCDFRGADTLVMELLKCETPQVTVYHIGERPRYIPDKYKTKVSQWKLEGGYENDELRDMAAIENCTHFLAVDFNSNEKRKSGTQKNIELCEALNKIRIK